MTVTKPKNIQDHYNVRALDYDSRWPDHTQALMAWVRRHWTPKTETVLELGCGMGHTLQTLSDHNARLHLTGVDVSRGMLRIAARRAPRARLICGDIENPAFTNTLKPADAVLSLSVIDHIRDLNAHIQLLHRLTHENGTVFLSGFAWTGLRHHLSAKHFASSHRLQTSAFTPKEMREKIMQQFAGHIEAHDILRPDSAWNIQIYKLRRR